MRQYIYFIVLASVLHALIACKKTDHRAPVNLTIDPIANESFGTKLSIDGNDMLQHTIWSKNSRELFLKTEEGTYRMNVASAITEQILSRETNGFIVQSTPDNQAAVFSGVVNGVNGFYTVGIEDKQVTELLRFSTNQSTMVYVGNNDMFYYKGDIVSVGRPCESWDDFYCGVRNGTVNVKFRHKRFDTNSEIDLASRFTFISYSPDGSKALLIPSDNQYTCYMYDVQTQILGDSLAIPFDLYELKIFHWDNNNTIRYAYIESVTSDIVIRDLSTGTEVKRFHSSLNITFSNLTWPENSNKIYYTGQCNTSDCTYSVYELNLNGMTERQLLFTKYTELQTSPFYLNPSPDGSMMVFSDGYASYLKPIN